MRLSALFVAGLSLSLFACSSSSGGTPNEPSNEAGGSQEASSAPTFTEVYTQVISVHCAPCHVAGMPGFTGGMLDMSTQAAAFTNLVGVEAAGEACSGMGKRVNPGDPSTSLIFEKVNMSTPPCGQRMPLGQSPLAADQITEIHDWIAAGAMNN
jgi:hypothetical protein